MILTVRKSKRCLQGITGLNELLLLLEIRLLHFFDSSVPDSWIGERSRTNAKYSFESLEVRADVSDDQESSFCCIVSLV